MILCGSLPLVPEYVDSISSKDIDSAESSLEGISSSDEERRSLFTGGVGTGSSSEWGTGHIADRRLGYLIFFLEDALKPVILNKNSNHLRAFAALSKPSRLHSSKPLSCHLTMQLVLWSRVYNRCVEPKTCPDHQFYSQNSESRRFWGGKRWFGAVKLLWS